MLQTKTSVIVSLQIEALHNFPGAEKVFPEVGFLHSLHRHIFHIKVKVPVYHDNRDKEFIMLKRDVTEFIHNKYYREDYRCCLFGAMSCEMIAREIMHEFGADSVEVWEDMENGAIIEVVNE